MLSRNDLEHEIARLKDRLAWMVKMYVRHIEHDGKRAFLFKRIESMSNRLEAYTNALQNF
jgi:hypothetical protein